MESKHTKAIEAATHHVQKNVQVRSAERLVVPAGSNRSVYFMLTNVCLSNVYLMFD